MTDGDWLLVIGFLPGCVIGLFLGLLINIAFGMWDRRQ